MVGQQQTHRYRNLGSGGSMMSITATSTTVDLSIEIDTELLPSIDAAICILDQNDELFRPGGFDSSRNQKYCKFPLPGSTALECAAALKAIEEYGWLAPENALANALLPALQNDVGRLVKIIEVMVRNCPEVTTPNVGWQLTRAALLEASTDDPKSRLLRFAHDEIGKMIASEEAHQRGTLTDAA
tara:strand:+ start:1217 stop:1771 length:555 start_codon:yes stop_codon:yes gene_type:complete